MRRFLLLISVIVFVDAMLFGILAPLVPGYADEFGLSKGEVGLLVGAFGAGALLGGVPGGLAAARYGPKLAVVIGLGLLALASFGFALAGGPWTLGLARFVQGVSSTVTWAGALAWLTVATPRDRRGELIGTAFGAAVFGAILGPMFGAVAEAVGIRPTFMAVGVAAVALAASGRIARSRAGGDACSRRARPRAPRPAGSSAACGSTRSRPSCSASSSCWCRCSSTRTTSGRLRSPRSSSSPVCSRRSSTRYSAASPTGAAGCCRSAWRSPPRSASRSRSPSRATPT